MNATGKLKIDLSEQFPHLRNAPIVEAVIDIRGHAEVPWEKEAVRAQLEVSLPEYKFHGYQREFEHELKMQAGQLPEPAVRDLGWKGLRLQSEDQRHIAQFNRDGFVFSRLTPYENWEQLYQETLRLWKIYLAIARPTKAQRIGLRFINRIMLPSQGLQLKNYIQPYPRAPQGLSLPVHAFFHQNTLAVPGHLYAINLIRTLQPPQGSEDIGLIIDIDVYTCEPVGLIQEVLDRCLAEMRWLKNKVFFGSITKETLKKLQ